MGDIIERIVNPVNVRSNEYYHEIGIRSHGKGIFYKEKIEGRLLGNKRVFWIKEGALILNIVFAWEQAVAKTTLKEKGMIASHRFPMFIPKEENANVDFLLHFFLTNKGKTLLELASPGGAGRNKTLGQSEFLNLRFSLPSYTEQQKITSFFTAIDQMLAQLKRKKNLLEQYKKGILKRIFSQEIRFKDDSGLEFPRWEKKRLGDAVDITKGEQLNRNELRSCWDYPCLNGGIEPSGYTDKYNTDENTVTISEGGNSCGYVNLMKTKFWCGGHCYKLVPKGFNTFYMYQLLKHNEMQIMELRVGTGLPNIQRKDIMKYQLQVTTSPSEQIKIASFLSAIDDKINRTQNLIERAEVWKKGLIQKMFV